MSPDSLENLPLGCKGQHGSEICPFRLVPLPAPHTMKALRLDFLSFLRLRKQILASMCRWQFDWRVKLCPQFVHWNGLVSSKCFLTCSLIAFSLVVTKSSQMRQSSLLRLRSAESCDDCCLSSRTRIN